MQNKNLILTFLCIFIIVGSRDETDIPIATDRKTTHHVPMDLDKRKTNSSKGVENGQVGAILLYRI